MQKYGIQKCFYGHLHGEAHREALIGEQEGILFELVSCDYLEFKVKKSS